MHSHLALVFKKIQNQQVCISIPFEGKNALIQTIPFLSPLKYFIQYLLFTVSYPSSGWGCLTTVKGCTSELWGPNSYSRFLLESVSPGANACAAVVKGYRLLLGWGLLPIKKWNAVWGVGFFPSYFSFSGRGLELCLIETKETRIRVHKKSNRSCLSSESTGRGWTPAALSCLHSLNK